MENVFTNSPPSPWCDKDSCLPSSPLSPPSPLPHFGQLRGLSDGSLWWQWKGRRKWKSKRPAYCLGSAESPTADFSLVPLMSTFSSSLMWWISHVVSKWGMVSWCPAFMGGLSPILYRLFVPARHAKKWPNPRGNQKSGFRLESLTRLTSVLSLSQKNVHDHCCCPISAIILMTS